MGQIKGNPAADRSVQNQAYTNSYTGGTSQSGADRRDIGNKPVMIDDQLSLKDVVDVDFETDLMAALVSQSVDTRIESEVSTINSTITSVSSSINTNITAVSSSINTNITAVSSSISSSINLTISVPGTYANDAAAEAAGVRIGGLYHTSGTVKVRLV